MKFTRLLTTFLISILFLACGGGSSSPNTPDPMEPDPVQLTRKFRMGFTPWLYEASLNAQATTYTRLLSHGDIVKHHLAAGIPWDEALQQTPYHPNVEAEINGRLQNTPVGTQVFLAIDSLNTGRDALTPYWGELDNMPLPGAWAARSWSSPEVIRAYLNFATDMIDRFQPSHFEYATEVSELIINDSQGYIDYLIFAQTVHSSLKLRYPDLKLMSSVSLKSPDSINMQLIEAAISNMIDLSDVIGISVYPYVFYDHSDRGDPANLPNDWLSQISDFSKGKPLAISETGWIGENLEISEFQYSESSDADKQNRFVSLLLQSAEDMDMEFVIWWTVADFDTLWNDQLAQDPLAKIWKDIGLYDENQQPREALQTWTKWLDRERLPD